MSISVRECRVCGREFALRPGKPGFVDVCENPACLKEAPETIQKVMAGVSWENKHTPVVEVMEAAQAKAFNGAQRRRGTLIVGLVSGGGGRSTPGGRRGESVRASLQSSRREIRSLASWDRLIRQLVESGEGLN